MSEFPEMLERGLGHAVLYLQQHDAVPYRDIILHACTHFVGFDSQTDADRAQFNFDLILASKDQDWYVPRLNQAFTTGEDVEMPEQLFELMGFFAQNGDTHARELMYAIFAEDASQYDTRGAEALIKLDGLSGYRFLAEQWWKYPLPETEYWYEGYWLDHVEERFGADAVAEALSNVRLSEYLIQTREKRRIWKEKRKPRKEMPLTYDAIQAVLTVSSRNTNRPRLSRWGSEIDEPTLVRLAEELLKENDLDRLYKSLHLFWKRPFPLDPAPLLMLARSADKGIALAAQGALVCIKNPAVRALALELITERDYRFSVKMLASNPQEDDYERLTARAVLDLSKDQFHRLELGIRDYFDAHPSSAAIPTLLSVYENGYCTMCRYGIVKSLLSLEALPDWMRDECRYDADVETRKLVT